jgi:hypothetical protein
MGCKYLRDVSKSTKLTCIGCPELKKAESTNEACNKTDEAALKIIRELGLKNNQQISEDDLCTTAKALYPEGLQTKIEAPLKSKILESRLHC